MGLFASGSKLFSRFLGGKGVAASAPKLTRQNAMSRKIGTAAKPKATRQTTLDDFFGKKPAAATSKSAVKPAVKPETAQRPWEDINTIFDNKTDQFKPLSAKKSEKLRRKAGGSPQATPHVAKPGTKPGAKPEDSKGGFLSNGLVQTIGGTVVGTLGVSALTSMFSGGGGSAEAAPAPAPAPAASGYDPFAASGSYGIPGSIPNYI